MNYDYWKTTEPDDDVKECLHCKAPTLNDYCSKTCYNYDNY